jgi:predicted RNA binding protein YcfA (HicA-like mRNA interferase family)
MNTRQITIKALKSAGYYLKRNGANHDIYFNPETKSTIPVKRHDFNENDMNYILKEAHIDRYR